jgi:hypothetical protein
LTLYIQQRARFFFHPTALAFCPAGALPVEALANFIVDVVLRWWISLQGEAHQHFQSVPTFSLLVTATRWAADEFQTAKIRNKVPEFVPMPSLRSSISRAFARIFSRTRKGAAQEQTG